jgi:stage III sporulation protein AD
LELVKIIGIGLITSLSAIIVKQIKPEVAILITISGSIIIILMLMESLVSMINVFDMLIKKTNIDRQLFASVLKIIGVGYLTEFSANICQDTGNSSIADKIMLSGKVIILILALPIITALVDIIVGIMP